MAPQALLDMSGYTQMLAFSSDTRLHSRARCLTLALMLVQVSRKRKSEDVTERSAEESAPVAPVAEDTGARAGLERPPKATKVRGNSALLRCTLQCSGVQGVFQHLR